MRLLGFGHLTSAPGSVPQNISLHVQMNVRIHIRWWCIQTKRNSGGGHSFQPSLYLIYRLLGQNHITFDAPAKINTCTAHLWTYIHEPIEYKINHNELTTSKWISFQWAKESWLWKLQCSTLIHFIIMSNLIYAHAWVVLFCVCTFSFNRKIIRSFAEMRFYTHPIFMRSHSVWSCSFFSHKLILLKANCQNGPFKLSSRQ